jgi:DUF4097 and DUF4098 domain-containing protein YvlB
MEGLRMMPAAIALGLALCLGAVPAQADEFREDVAVRAGGTLRVELAMGGLEIETHDDARVEVEASSGGWGGGLEFTLTGDGTNARLVGERAGLPFMGFGARVRVRVPEEYSLDLTTGGGAIEIEAVQGSVRAKTSGGSIDLEGAVGAVDLRTSGGAIRVEEVEGDTVLRTSGGSITASDIDGALEVETSGGPIRLQDVDGPVRAHTSGGGISARFAGAPAGELRTSGGSIEVELPEGTGAELEARTSGGRVSIDGEITVSGDLDRSEVRGRLGPGGERLVLQTSGGNIRVRAR